MLACAVSAEEAFRCKAIEFVRGDRKYTWGYALEAVIKEYAHIWQDKGDLLILGWGGTYGAIRSATKELQAQGHRVSHMHLRHLNPLPKNVETALGSFKQVVAAELNFGQLRMLLRAKFLKDIKGINKVQGQPFRISELVEKASAFLAQ